LADGSLNPEEQRQLARLEQWKANAGRGPADRPGPGPRGGAPAPER
jgi:hypothetical protein